ncbi:SDR family NAD(P)-dependent oxidoreductase [Streptomyces canus]|uniref:SDR family NAD(P)-dependent oxidoreductase n=1 Tax=Streptomyces canus TaxID=58343 RepID=UPI0033F4CF46
MPTLALVGAGSGMGLAIARTFGIRGFDVALISRTKEKLQTLVDRLGQEGITAAAFPADVLDSASLTDALDAAKARFGGIDVLEYSPAPHSPVPGVTLAAPSEATVDNLQPQIEYSFYGAVAAPSRADRAATYGPDGMVFVGGPDEITDRILHLHGLLGHTRQILQMDVGGMPQRDFLHGIELLGTKVLPQIRAEPATS